MNRNPLLSIKNMLYLNYNLHFVNLKVCLQSYSKFLCNLIRHFVCISDNINIINPNIFNFDTKIDDTSTIQLVNCKNPDLIARFHSLQTIILHTGFENSKPQEVSMANAMLRLTEELAKSLIDCIEYIELQPFKDYNPTHEYKLQSEAYRAARVVKRDGQQLACLNEKRDKKMIYESRILSSVAAICRKYPSIANTIMDTEWTIESSASDVPFTGTLVNALIETFKQINYSVGGFESISMENML